MNRIMRQWMAFVGLVSLTVALACGDPEVAADADAGAGGGGASDASGGGEAGAGGVDAGGGGAVGGDVGAGGVNVGGAGGGDAGVGGAGGVDAGAGGVDVGVGGAGGGGEPGPVPWESNFNLLPQDENGFSIFTPSADSRIVYVSASTGDDASGAVYAANSPEVGADPFAPSGPVMAYRTIGQAHSQMRSGSPDWMLLERGQVWTGAPRIDVKSGRSPSERALIGAYGAAPQRPLIRTGTTMGLRFFRSVRFAAVAGLAFVAHERDPNDPSFIGFDNVDTVAGFSAYAEDELTPNATILIEDSAFSFYSNNIIQGASPTEDFVVRRCQITNNYATNRHAQGLYSKGASVLLEENLFDHNGWHRQSYVRLNDEAEGQATFYNHNTYFTNTHDTIFRRNIFLRSSSIGNKFTANPPDMTDEVMVENVLLDNNLYVEGEIGVSAGGNDDYGDGHRWRNILIVNNVLLDIGRGQPTNRTLGWDMEVRDWDGGAVSFNYFGPYGNASVGNIYALSVQGHTRNVDIIGNVIHGLRSARYAVNIDGDPKEQIVFSQNQLQLGGTQMRLIDSAYLAAMTFSNNSYYTDNDSGPFRVGGERADFAAWQAAVGDPGSSFEHRAYSDPGRTVESYMATQGGEATLQAFIDAAKSQSKQSWRPAFTAAAVNDYVRQGYEPGAP